MQNDKSFCYCIMRKQEISYGCTIWWQNTVTKFAFSSLQSRRSHQHKTFCQILTPLCINYMPVPSDAFLILKGRKSHAIDLKCWQCQSWMTSVELYQTAIDVRLQTFSRRTSIWSQSLTLVIAKLPILAHPTFLEYISSFATRDCQKFWEQWHFIVPKIFGSP